jgi:hypothetical protein
MCMAAVGLTAVTGTMGCKTEPAPIVIYEDRRDSIWLKFDPESGSGHSHPFQISPVMMARILAGVYVQHRDVVAGFGMFFGDKEGDPAFTATQIAFAAPLLVEALRKASPKDMATFYLVSGDKREGKLVTSGGIFVQDGRLHLILANARTSPVSVQYENTYVFDQREEPLVPLARKKFIVGFHPAEAWVPNKNLRGKAGYESYVDEAKLVIVDLQALAALPMSSSSPAKAASPSSPGPRP